MKNICNQKNVSVNGKLKHNYVVLKPVIFYVTKTSTFNKLEPLLKIERKFLRTIHGPLTKINGGYRIK